MFIQIGMDGKGIAVEFLSDTGKMIAAFAGRDLGAAFDVLVHQALHEIAQGIAHLKLGRGELMENEKQ